MLVACRLAGLSALEPYYAGVRVGAQTFGPRVAAHQLDLLVQSGAKNQKIGRQKQACLGHSPYIVGQSIPHLRRTVRRALTMVVSQPKERKLK
jgi:hypothetical protein